MTVDLDKLRMKYTQLEKTFSGGDNFMNKFFQVADGTNMIRILPSSDEDTEFYAETKIHRINLPNEGGEMMAKNVHCRSMHGEPCPLCDAYRGLWKTDSKADEDRAREIKPRSRFYMNIVDRNTGEVKILSVGIMLFQKIIAAMLDEDYGDITDLQTGHDFKIVKVQEGRWPKYDQSAPRPKPSTAGSEAEVATWMDSLHDIADLVKLEEYEEVKTYAQNILPTLTYEQTVERPVPEVSTETTDDSSITETDEDYLARLKA